MNVLCKLPQEGISFSLGPSPWLRGYDFCRKSIWILTRAPTMRGEFLLPDTSMVISTTLILPSPKVSSPHLTYATKFSKQNES